MNYRLYVDGTAGYYELGTYSSKETIACLHWLIIEEGTKERVLAIECNEEKNIEFPVFLYDGNTKEFFRFAQYLRNENSKHKVTRQFVKNDKNK